METKVITMASREFGIVRKINENGTTLYCGSDVAKSLGYVNPRKALSDHCRGVTKRDTPTKSGMQKMSFIPEGDVWRLICHSKLPNAEQFEKWIFDDVVPTVAKTGKYNLPTKAKGLSLETSEYFYFDKFYNGEPVLVPADIEHFTGIGRYCAEGCLKKYGKKKTDYLLLEGEELAKFKRENPKTSKMASAVFLIRKSGFVKLLKRYSCKVDMPKCFVEEKKAKPQYCKENRNFITPNDVEKICEECCIAMSDGKRYIPADIAKRISCDAVGFLITASKADDSLKNAVAIYENKVSGDTYRMECLTELGVKIAAQIHNVYLGGDYVSGATSLAVKR